MIKPRRLKRGDKVAVVSLSWGGLGDAQFHHKYVIAKQRLEVDFGLEVVAMPHALKGSAFVAAHPECRAKDWMDALKDPSIAAVFSAIGGDDTIRLLPYVDFDVMRAHPKIFMGYSDTTVNHLMLYKAGVTSFYGPSVMAEFGEYVQMFDYTVQAVQAVLFGDTEGLAVTPSRYWSNETVPWEEKNQNVSKSRKLDTRGFEVLQGRGKVRGHLLGGCLDVFMMVIGTSIWPTLDQWRGAVLFLETSEDQPTPDFVKWTLRNLAAQGVLKVLSAIIVGKPHGGVYDAAYKDAYLDVVAGEEGLVDLPIFYNMNFGHTAPMTVLPYGVAVALDCDAKTLVLLESATEK